MRHENGNCTVAGGFCTAVNDPICEALHNAYDCGRRSAFDELVPCAECIHSRELNEHEEDYLSDGVIICTSQDAIDSGWNPVWPDDFCSYGKRREEDVGD